MRSNKIKTNKGITLIALVITIIVMLILVAVAISMAINGGLFDYAGKAVGDTQNAIDAEQELGNGKIKIGDEWYNSIDEYLGITEEKGEDILGIDGEIFSALYTQTKDYTDTNGDTAVIPKGFSVGKSKGINTIDEGLVIQDSKGNQFVWIPVTYIPSGTLDDNGLDSGFLEVFKNNTYAEPYYAGYEGESTEYYKMMLSVQKNKGFYVGRFEGGTEEARYLGVANETDTLVVKRDVYPYNYVAWGTSDSNYVDTINFNFDSYTLNNETGLDQGHGAVYLSKHLLDGQNTGATSTLCYGAQWDAMLRFIGKDTETDSTEWGNYGNNEYIITRTTAQYAPYNADSGEMGEWTTIPEEGKRKTNEEGFLLTTGASDEFEAKNIYDVAGNGLEWTMLAGSTGGRTFRGGWYRASGLNFPVSGSSSSFRNYICMPQYTFRCALYITNENDDFSTKQSIKGAFVEYGVAYTDIYVHKEFKTTNGWRLLDYTDNGDGTISDVKLISTGIPARLYYYECDDSDYSWYVTDENKLTSFKEILGGANFPCDTGENDCNLQQSAGLYYNFGNIKFQYKTYPDPNYGFYSSITVNGTTYNTENRLTKKGDEVFKTGEYAESVRLLTLGEICEGLGAPYIYGTFIIPAAADLSGLFRLDQLSNLPGMEDVSYPDAGSYWIATPWTGDSTAYGVSAVVYDGRVRSVNVGTGTFVYGCGVRPVVSLKSDLKYTIVDSVDETGGSFIKLEPTT